MDSYLLRRSLRKITGVARSALRKPYGLLLQMSRGRSHFEEAARHLFPLFEQTVDLLVPQLGAGARGNLPALFSAVASGPRSLKAWRAEFEYILGAKERSKPSILAPRLTSPRARRLKILIVSAMYPSTLHAGGLRLFDIIKQLAQRHDIELFSVYDRRLDEASSKMLSGVLAREKLVDWEDFVAVEGLRWIEANHGPGFSFDVIHFEYPQAAQMLVPFRRIARRAIFGFMECLTKRHAIDLSFALDERPSKASIYFRTLIDTAVSETGAVLEADGCIFVSKPDRAYMDRLCEGPAWVIPTGVSPTAILGPLSARLSRGQVSEQATVLFIASFDSPPNIEAMSWYIRNVHPRVLAAVPGYKLTIVGRGDTSALRVLRPRDPSLHFTGTVGDLTECLVRATVCIAPLISGAGFHGKINQYSAAGKATVSTSIGALGTEYADGTSILLADTPAAFSGAVISLLKDSALRQSIAEEAGRVVARCYAWPSLIKQIEDVYQAVLAS